MRRSDIGVSEAPYLLDQWVVWAKAFFRHLEHTRSRWQSEYESGYQEESQIDSLPDGDDSDMELVDAAMTLLRQGSARAYVVLTHRHVNGRRYAYTQSIYNSALQDFCDAFNRLADSHR